MGVRQQRKHSEQNDACHLIERESVWLNEKRAHYILDKWDSKGWYDYGTLIDGGWLTVKGLSVMV